MRFSEHELTAALHGVAKSVLRAQRKVRRGADVDEVWEQMDRLQRFKILDGLGSQVLPVLVALPDVEVAPGTRPSYDDATISEVLTQLLDADSGGLGRLKRAVVLKGRVALVQIALASVPLRRDPDALLHADDAAGDAAGDDFEMPDIPDHPGSLT
ncbi:hypothetical protein [Nocardioides sp.]|uniref:hypothetical protein n=1 Tax=Nocardioides sp. TaxID=35761 RepID=UPI002B269707|nr:hypothetical protein [Nocardioides sp.]